MQSCNILEQEQSQVSIQSWLMIQNSWFIDDSMMTTLSGRWGWQWHRKIKKKTMIFDTHRTHACCMPHVARHCHRMSHVMSCNMTPICRLIWLHSYVVSVSTVTCCCCSIYYIFWILDTNRYKPGPESLSFRIIHHNHSLIIISK